MNADNECNYLTATTSLCRVCARLLPARVEMDDDGIWFHKECPDHGTQDLRVYPDVEAFLGLGRFFRPASTPLAFSTDAARGCPDSCGLCPQHEQHVCMPIIEITDYCDLACPVCLVKNRASYHLCRAQVATVLDRLIASEGQIPVLTLSGGEPTLNPEFRGIVEECISRPEILRVSVSTNGLSLVADAYLLRFLAERNVCISLQFDGLRGDIYPPLRGRPLLTEKLRLLDMAGQLDAPVSLTVTVARGVNDGDLHGVLDLLFERDHILSVMLQPIAHTGRASSLPRLQNAVTIPDIIRALDGARGGKVRGEDFSPLPCSHPACFSLAFYLRIADGRFISVKSLASIDRYLDMIQNRGLFGTDADSFQNIRDAVYELWSGPAGAAPDSQQALAAIRRLMQAATSRGGYEPRRALDVGERSVKSIFIHHFMDRDSFDLARARKCCNVYPLVDGRMIPCCVHNCLRR